jgi:DnaJ-class molecular chaperone
MADDPYKILGLARTATGDEIRSAYRKLAKKHHPDLNPGNKAAEEKFKEISTANELLSDPEKRARFDKGEIDASGAEKAPQRSYRQYAESGGGERYSGGGAGGFGGENFEDIFSTIFEARGGGRAGPARGADARYVLEAEFLDAINGATRRLTLPDGQVLDVKIPPGTSAGDVLRLRGRGQPGRAGGPAGDALIEIQVGTHPFYRREGQDLFMDLPVSLNEAVLGGRIEVPTPGGEVAMKLKPHVDTGTELRLRSRGVPAHGKLAAGDLYVKLRVTIGPVDERLEAFLKDWHQEDYDPRATMGGAKP